MVSFGIPRTVIKNADNETAYGDMNLFCTCSPVDTLDGDMTGAAAPMPT
jgi:hypothetical protein